MRQERMEADARERELDEEFQAKQRALLEQEEQRTAKRRAKRLKKKVQVPVPAGPGKPIFLVALRALNSCHAPSI